MSAITLNAVWLKYRVEFKENGKFIPEDFWSLKGVSFDVHKGEVVGIIGENGAGKSTLLKIIAGMLSADKGSVAVEGRAAGLIELGGGFHRELTGKENIYMIFSLFGFSRAQTQERYDDVVRFAALGRFINAPVKSYSQGMYMRLGFAIAIHVNPDIVLIDEAFVVGDTYSQRKCINKLFELKEQGKTILFVSHDLEIAKRVCSRGIVLREGSIVKDGPIDEVCNYYLETVGDKKGIAFLKKGPLGVVFNNGKLILRWENHTLTPHAAGHSAIVLAGREYVSSLADWHIEKGGDLESGIIACGRWPDTDVVCRWRINLASEHELAWEITLDSVQATAPERCEARVVLSNAYEKWFNVDTEKDFPALFSHGQEWQCDLIDDSLAGVVGVQAQKTFPAIVFDRLLDNQQTKCHIGNTGSDVGARVLYYTSFPARAQEAYGGTTVFRSKILFFDPARGDGAQEYLNHSRQLLREAIVVRSDPLSLFCQEHHIQVYWQEKLLTRLSGLNTQFKYMQRNYSAANGRWTVRRAGDHEVTVSVAWEDVPGLRQLWRLCIKDKETIAWDITMESNAQVKITNRQTELLLNAECSRWFTPEESGEFEKLEKKGGVVVLNKYINTCVGIDNTNSGADSYVPKTALCCDNGAAKVAYLFKIKDDAAMAAKLQLVEIDTPERAGFFSGESVYFKGQIKIEDRRSGTAALIKDAVSQDKEYPYALTCGRTRFVFNNGKGLIFWDAHELTRGLGFYSSILLADRWHDSSQASWEICALTGTQLVAIGRWPWVPMEQKWEITLAQERCINVKISKQIWDNEASAAEREQVCLMMSGAYKEWFSPRQIKASFPNDFIEHTGAFWERLWCADHSNPIGVAKGAVRKGIFKVHHFPSVIFASADNGQARHAIIENTDNLFQARVLQYEMIPGAQAASRTDAYFEGCIKIQG